MGFYSIGTAARLAGVSVATLRNWEHRYGLVVASRSSGGQRQYSSYQIEQLRTLHSWVARGFSAAEAHRILEAGLRDLSADVSAHAARARVRWSDVAAACHHAAATRAASAAMRDRAAAARAASAAARQRRVSDRRQLTAGTRRLMATSARTTELTRETLAFTIALSGAHPVGQSPHFLANRQIPGRPLPAEKPPSRDVPRDAPNVPGPS